MAKWGSTSKKRSNFRIIDDDAPCNAHRSDNEDQDESPTVAFVIDERPSAVKQLEEYTDKSKWRTLMSKSNFKTDPEVEKSKPDRPRNDCSDSEDAGSDAGFKKKRKHSANDERKSPKQSKRDSRSKKSRKEVDEMQTASTKPKGGITNAAEVRRDLAERRKREDELFTQNADALGANAETVVRDRRTGKKIDRERVEAEKRVEEEREQQKTAQYARWAAGVKQIEMRDAAVEEYVAESAKPLTRYADDTDRDALLKSVIRTDDPMRDLLSSKTKPGAQQEAKPRYRGAFPPNRFSIEPGYRWDGVDRSNGFEKRYYDSLANRAASREENYRWATADL